MNTCNECKLKLSNFDDDSTISIINAIVCEENRRTDVYDV